MLKNNLLGQGLKQWEARKIMNRLGSLKNVDKRTKLFGKLVYTYQHNFINTKSEINNSHILVLFQLNWSI